MTNTQTRRRIERLELRVNELMERQSLDWIRSLPDADLEAIVDGLLDRDLDDPDLTEHERELIQTSRRLESGLVVDGL